MKNKGLLWIYTVSVYFITLFALLVWHLVAGIDVWNYVAHVSMIFSFIFAYLSVISTKNRSLRLFSRTIVMNTAQKGFRFFILGAFIVGISGQLLVLICYILQPSVILKVILRGASLVSCIAFLFLMIPMTIDLVAVAASTTAERTK